MSFRDLINPRQPIPIRLDRLENNGLETGYVDADLFGKNVFHLLLEGTVPDESKANIAQALATLYIDVLQGQALTPEVIRETVMKPDDLFSQRLPDHLIAGAADLLTTAYQAAAAKKDLSAPVPNGPHR